MKGKQLAAVSILAAFFLVIFNLPSSMSRPIRVAAREFLSPYQSGINRFLDATGDMLSSAVRVRQIARERDRLASELASLRRDVRQSEMVERENAELRHMLAVAQKMPFRMVAADVIARDDSGGWWRTVRLNKGRRDGVATNMAVISTEGVIGRVVEATPSTCDVLLLTDRNSKVAARFASSGAFGIVRGQGISFRGDSTLDMLHPAAPLDSDYLRKEIHVLNGEEVVTSGLGGVFPSDLVIGTVTRVYMDESGLYQHAEVRPAADLARLRRVFIVMWRENDRAEALEPPPAPVAEDAP